MHVPGPGMQVCVFETSQLEVLYVEVLPYDACAGGVHSVWMGNLRYCCLEVAPALEKCPGNGNISPPNHVTEAREMCCLDRGPILSGVNPICKIREHYY